MAIACETIQEYTLSINKKSFWLCFNEVYNRAYIYKEYKEGKNPFDKKHTDNKAREEFLQFMKTHFPKTSLTMVFDTAPVGYLLYPYLGSIAVDCDENDAVYKALSEKYELENGVPKSLNAVFYEMSVDVAKKICDDKRNEFENF